MGCWLGLKALGLLSRGGRGKLREGEIVFLYLEVKINHSSIFHIYFFFVQLPHVRNSCHEGKEITTSGLNAAKWSFGEIIAKD